MSRATVEAVNFDDVNLSGGASYLQPGYGEVEIVALKHKTAAEAFSGKETFIAELKIISHSWNPSDGGEQMLAGEIRSYIVTHHPGPKTGKLYAQDVARFLVAADGSNSVDSAKYEFALSEEQPLAGVRIGFRGRIVKTKADKDFTRMEWRSLQ